MQEALLKKPARDLSNQEALDGFIFLVEQGEIELGTRMADDGTISSLRKAQQLDIRLVLAGVDFCHVGKGTKTNPPSAFFGSVVPPRETTQRSVVRHADSFGVGSVLAEAVIPAGTGRLANPYDGACQPAISLNWGRSSGRRRAASRDSDRVPYAQLHTSASPRSRVGRAA